MKWRGPVACAANPGLRAGLTRSHSVASWRRGEVNLGQFRIERQLQDGGNVFRLRAPIQVEIAEEGGMWHCESAAFGILAAGSSQEDALRSFAEDVAVLWEEIAQAPDAERRDRGELALAYGSSIENRHSSAERFIDCELSEAGYFRLLVETGQIRIL